MVTSEQTLDGRPVAGPGARDQVRGGFQRARRHTKSEAFHF